MLNPSPRVLFCLYAFYFYFFLAQVGNLTSCPVCLAACEWKVLLFTNWPPTHRIYVCEYNYIRKDYSIDRNKCTEWLTASNRIIKERGKCRTRCLHWWLLWSLLLRCDQWDIHRTLIIQVALQHALSFNSTNCIKNSSYSTAIFVIINIIVTLFGITTWILNLNTLLSASSVLLFGRNVATFRATTSKPPTRSRWAGWELNIDTSFSFPLLGQFQTLEIHHRRGRMKQTHRHSLQQDDYNNDYLLG